MKTKLKHMSKIRITSLIILSLITVLAAIIASLPLFFNAYPTIINSNEELSGLSKGDIIFMSSSTGKDARVNDIIKLKTVVNGEDSYTLSKVITFVMFSSDLDSASVITQKNNDVSQQLTLPVKNITEKQYDWWGTQHAIIIPKVGVIFENKSFLYGISIGVLLLLLFSALKDLK